MELLPALNQCITTTIRIDIWLVEPFDIHHRSGILQSTGASWKTLNRYCSIFDQLSVPRQKTYSVDVIIIYDDQVGS